jgi:hypothetical protein
MALTIPAGVAVVTEIGVVVPPLLKESVKALPLFKVVLREGKLVLAVLCASAVCRTLML